MYVCMYVCLYLCVCVKMKDRSKLYTNYDQLISYSNHTTRKGIFELRLVQFPDLKSLYTFNYINLYKYF